MKIRTISETDSSTLMTWFSNQKQLTEWAGPDFSFPFTQQSFNKYLSNNGSHSFSLIADSFDGSGELIGFGQCYLKSGRCNLARLVIAPHMRGLGLATNCVYKKAGFVIQSAPQEITIENCLYMVKCFVD